MAVAPDVPEAGRDDQIQEPNNEQNEAEVTEWETPVQETGQRTRSVMVVTVPDLPAPNNDTEDTAECWRTPLQEIQCTP